MNLINSYNKYNEILNLNTNLKEKKFFYIKFFLNN